MKLLMIDDNPAINELVADYAEKYTRYSVHCVENSKEALESIRLNAYNLILLDVELGNESGLEIISDVKSLFHGPILYISCLDDRETVIKGLKLGADDYITKPFDFEELFLRVDRSLERAGFLNLITVDNYTINTMNKEITKDGKKLNLGIVATEIFILILRNANKVVSREMISESVWDVSYDFNTRVIDTHVSSIRKETLDYRLKSVRGIGYMFKVDDD